MKPRPLRSGPFLLLCAFAVLSACAGETGRGGRAKNVLLITLDTTRADYFSCNGHARANTPRLDALAAEGTNFTRAMSSSAVTPVSHATILTGRFPDKHGLRVLVAPSGFRLGADVPTLTSILKRKGYRTAAIHSALPVSGVFGFARDFDHFDSFDPSEPFQHKSGGDDEQVGWDVQTHQRRSDETSQRALDWLTGTRGDAAPWFLWLHYWDPHDAGRFPPDEFLDPTVVRRRANGVLVRNDDGAYAEEVRYMDSQIGRVLDALRSSPAWRDTVVVVTADHGEGLSDGLEIHHWAAHRELYREQLHVPLIVRLPGERGGTVSDALVRTADIVPTVLEALDAPLPAALDGASLLPLMRGEGAAPRMLYAEQINGYDKNAQMIEKRPLAAFVYGLVDEEWKLLWRPTHPEWSELFHLRSDPQERRNVWNEEYAAGDRLRLLSELARREPWVTREFPPLATGGASAEELAALSRALSAIGYAAGDGGEDAAARERWPWAWTCPDGGETYDEPGWCDSTGSPRLLIARGKQLPRR